jgi:hypothetical protein
MVDSSEIKERVTPEEGYAVVQLDTMKPPSSDDFLTQVLVEEDPHEIELPPPGGKVEFLVYDSDGNEYDYNTWDPDEVE